MFTFAMSRPVSDRGHGDGQVAANRNAPLHRSENGAHAGSVRELGGGVGGGAGGGPGRLRVSSVAVELQS